MTVNLVRKKKKKPPTFKGHYAGFVSRFLAFVIDTVLVSTAIAVCVTVIQLVARFFNIDLPETVIAVSNISPFFRAAIVFLTGFGFNFVINLIYTTLFWVLVGKTIGKAIMGLRVIGPGGSRITFGRAIRRYIGYWISSFLFLGYLWILVSDERQGWHDIIAGTGVIYDYEAQYSDDLGRLATYAPRIENKMKKHKALPAGNQAESIEEIEE